VWQQDPPPPARASACVHLQWVAQRRQRTLVVQRGNRRLRSRHAAVLDKAAPLRCVRRAAVSRRPGGECLRRWHVSRAPEGGQARQSAACAVPPPSLRKADTPARTWCMPDRRSRRITISTISPNSEKTARRRLQGRLSRALSARRPTAAARAYPHARRPPPASWGSARRRASPRCCVQRLSFLEGAARRPGSVAAQRPRQELGPNRVGAALFFFFVFFFFFFWDLIGKV